MDVLVWLIPMALLLGGLGLAAFLWALRSGQFDDLDGAAHRILFDDDPPPAATNAKTDTNSSEIAEVVAPGDAIGSQAATKNGHDSR